MNFTNVKAKLVTTGAFGGSDHKFLCPYKCFVIPSQIYFEHIIKTKILSPQICIFPSKPKHLIAGRVKANAEVCKRHVAKVLVSTAT